MPETKIDLKDRKILYELDLDCRQSNTQIGKKVGLTRDVVAYRINRLQEEGVIKNFWTAIDTYKLGYLVFRIYINFQYVSSAIKKEIVQHFVDYRNAWAVISLKGEIDFDVVIWVKDVYELYKFWNQTLDKFEEYFAKYTFSTLVEVFIYKPSFLLGDTSGNDRLMYTTTCSGQPVVIDQIDYDILNEIALNARIPLIDLAEKLNCTSQTINNRLKNLTNTGVIRAYRVNINLQHFHLYKYKLEIYLRDHKQRKAIWEYVKQKSYCDTLDVSVGWCDLEFELIIKSIDELTQIQEDLFTKFPKAIKKQSFWIVDEYHRERWLPEFQKN